MNRTRRYCLFGIYIVFFFSAVSTAAETTQNRLSGHAFMPSPFRGNNLAAEQVERWVPGMLRASVLYEFSKDPFQLDFSKAQGPCSGTQCIGNQRIISSAHQFNLQIGLGLARWLQVALDIPLVSQSFVTNPSRDVDEGVELLTSQEPIRNQYYAETVPADPSLAARVIFPSIVEKVESSFAAKLVFPLGDKDSFTSEGDFSGILSLNATTTPWRILTVSAGVGYWLRPENHIAWDDLKTTDGKIPLYGTDDELLLSAALHLLIFRSLSAGVEAMATVPLITESYQSVRTEITTNSSLCKSPVPGYPCEVTLENEIAIPHSATAVVLGSVRYALQSGLAFQFGAGADVSTGERSAALRILAGLQYQNPAINAAGDAFDSDADGVVDSTDLCPSEAEDRDGFQDIDGCPDRDNDSDGILDASDKCRDSAEDFDGFADRDGCPDSDNDADLINDDRDGCPDKAEDFDKFQDDDGCPEVDNDGDEIADASDSCPMESETANGYQDEDGCPDSLTVDGTATFGDGSGNLLRLTFVPNAAVLGDGLKKQLDDVFEVIRRASISSLVRIEGHADSAERSPVRLSEARAEVIRGYLISKGISAARLQAVGYGASRPMVATTDNKSKTVNMRVEIVVVVQSK